MKITVLSDCSLTDDNIAYLKSLGEVQIFDATADEATAIARMAGQDIILGDMFETPLNAKVLEHAKSVKLLCINSTGYDMVDLAAAAKTGIAIANAPGFSTEAVAEHVFALIFTANRHIIEWSAAVKAKPFQINPADRADYKYLGFNLHGRTIGIIGLGAIGLHVAKIANGFGMKVLGYNRSQKSIPNVELVSLDALLLQSDIVSIHTPLNDESRNLIDSATITKMKKGAILINTARGGSVVSQDLAAALESGKIAAAGLDVLDKWTVENPLMTSPNTIITPHSAWFTAQALRNLGNIMTDNVRAFIQGTPQNIVS